MNLDPLRPPRDRRRWFVVCYDIPNTKRRTRIMKLLEGYGRRAQFSVFECHLSDKSLRELRERLEKIIEPAQDDVRIYHFCANCRPKARYLGKAKRHEQEPFRIV
ncbi:MAG: CRISPR-associated endonuclease Cas2 [Caldilineaceae bacterium]|nr:CRISPR-associated endonuclease Cas2 [Caldilineaceae bacterium]